MVAKCSSVWLKNDDQTGDNPEKHSFWSSFLSDSDDQSGTTLLGIIKKGYLIDFEIPLWILVSNYVVFQAFVCFLGYLP